VSDSKASGDKLQKVLASLGYGSRRQMEDWIRAGRVRVNGEPAHLGQRVTAEDDILVDGKAPRRRAADWARVLVYNKPAGEICTRQDPEGRPTVYRALPPLKRGRWISVGRLDVATTGLLLLTNDGELANRLMHPSTGLDREYAVRVTGELTDAQCQSLVEGVVIDGELHRFSDLQYYDGSGHNHWYHVVLMEGKNREVRRLFESVGLLVSRLKRVRYGPVMLPSTLRRGQVGELSGSEVRSLYRIVGLPEPEVTPRRAERGGREVDYLLPYPELPAARVQAES